MSKALLERLEQASQRISAVWESLRPLHGGNPDNELFEAIYELREVAIDAVADTIGDRFKWLDWYIHENGWGAKGLEAGYDQDLRPVRTLDDLLRLIDTEDKA